MKHVSSIGARSYRRMTKRRVYHSAVFIDKFEIDLEITKIFRASEIFTVQEICIASIVKKG